MSLTGKTTPGYIIRGKVSKLDTLRGYSAYEVAVINGFNGTKEEWLASLKGEPFVYEDFTKEQLAALKGEPFRYEDFTPEQLNGLAGAVTTFNGRKGAVVPQSGDYTAAMVGAAPDGFGLGKNLNWNKGEEDANLFTKFGYFVASTNTPDGSWCYILHLPYGDDRATQFGFSASLTSVNDRYSYAKREKNSGTWQPWEWANPPLSPNKEYRTTERYNGKPVYCKLVEYGATSADTPFVIGYASDATENGRYLRGSVSGKRNGNTTVTANQTGLYYSGNIFNCDGLLYDSIYIRQVCKCSEALTDVVGVAYYTKE